jgi:mRNA-degrading endonuclease RelE of RelBE toxin-antitoxin system
VQYRLVYSPEAIDHLKQLTAHQRSIVLDTVEKQLKHQPLEETRNRKPMRPNPLAQWELRAGNLRIYYDVVVELDSEPTVFILAVGIKERNRISIGGRVVEEL